MKGRRVHVLGAIHVGCSILALPLGAVILLRPKATKSHIWLGRIYLACMICVNGFGLAVYHLTGGFNVFHLLAILNLAIILIAVIHIIYRRRMRNWLWRHYQYMSWSYVGLLAGAVNEAMVRVPLLNREGAGPPPWLQLSATVAVLGVSALLIFSMQKRMLTRYSMGD
jgi:uncharacterized membrane protein